MDTTSRMTHPGALIELAEPSAIDPSIVGSKAANLAILAGAGFNVPRGVVIPVMAATAEESFVDELLDTFGDAPLAVRSSATYEDLADASFAGQYESFLMVRGPEALEAAIQACIDSQRTERVSTYAGDVAGTGMAVLIQPMVDADAAGVAFSANPVTGARDEVLIDAVVGLGDKLVSGEVDPDRWVVSADSVISQPGSEHAIGEVEAARIAELCRDVEAHFGVPQDIEWAIEDGELILLQARPITTLPDPPVELVAIDFEVPPGYWEQDVSHAPAAIYPIESLVPRLLDGPMERWAHEFGYLFDGLDMRDIGGWHYMRLKPVGGKEGPLLPGWLMWGLVRVIPMLRTRIAVAKEAVRTDKAGRFIDRWYDDWLPELSERISRLQAIDRPALSYDELDAHIDEVVALARRGVEIHALTHGALALILYEFTKTCEELLGWDMASSLKMVSGTSFKSTEPSRALKELADVARARPDVLDPDSVPEGGLAAHLNSVDPELASAFGAYLDRYGHRSLGHTFADPTIAEVPSLVMAMIRDQIETAYDPDAIAAENEASRNRAVDRAREMLVGNAAATARFERVLARAVRAYPAREDNEFFTISAPFALLRYVLMELGRRLADRGQIDDAEDVMFLEYEDARRALGDGGDRHDQVAVGKGKRAWAMANPGPPSYGKETPPPSSLSFLPAGSRLPMESMLWSLDSIMAIETSGRRQDDASAIVGTPVSSGTYTGPVRVVMDESEFYKLRAGDVLVCPITSPVWSVLFPTIGALVTDTGGVLSHPAIIAREYRIPGVVATGNATQLLRDGQIVTVDGTTGTVTAN